MKTETIYIPEYNHEQRRWLKRLLGYHPNNPIKAVKETRRVIMNTIIYNIATKGLWKCPRDRYYNERIKHELLYAPSDAMVYIEFE